MAVFRVEKTKDYTVMSNHHLKNKKREFYICEEILLFHAHPCYYFIKHTL